MNPFIKTQKYNKRFNFNVWKLYPNEAYDNTDKFAYV